MSSSSRLLACAGAFLLAACDIQTNQGSQVHITSPRLSEDAELTRVALDYLTAKRMPSFDDNAPCSGRFTITNARIAARHIEGDRGKLEMLIDVQALSSIGENSDASNFCYGSPPGGWTPGQTATSRQLLSVERWDSG